MSSLRLFMTGCLALLLLGGCQSDLGANTYSREEAGRAQSVQTGVIVALRPVNIEGTKTPIGSGAGAAIGGIGGSTLGGGRGKMVMAVIGAVAGGMLGAAAEEGLTRVQGVEITVREDDGKQRAYVQQMKKDEILRVGDRVRILSVGGRSRVSTDDAH